MSPTALLLIAVFVAAASPLCLGAVLLAALCHELGHYGALRLCGGRLEGCPSRRSGHRCVFVTGSGSPMAGRLCAYWRGLW